jgi:hypothetical protein
MKLLLGPAFLVNKFEDLPRLVWHSLHAPVYKTSGLQELFYLERFRPLQQQDSVESLCQTKHPNRSIQTITEAARVTVNKMY